MIFISVFLNGFVIRAVCFTVYVKLAQFLHILYDNRRPRVTPAPLLVTVPCTCIFLNCPNDAVRLISVNYPVYWNWVVMIFVLQNDVSYQDVLVEFGF
jgi:hypothetical protein